MVLMQSFSIRAVVNVDSCGTTGREILFQANSREMIDAYKQAPYPHGTVMVSNFALYIGEIKTTCNIVLKLCIIPS